MRFGNKTALNALRYHANEYLLGSWLDTMIPESTVTATIREVLASHQVYRDRVNPIGQEAQVGWKWAGHVAVPLCCNS